MTDGQLQTVGSSFFLKKRFGSGYKLICVKNLGCNVNVILNVLRKYVPEVEVESNTQSEAVFIVNEDYSSAFNKMFKRIENESEILGISSFGFSLTTLEEVFIKVGHDDNKSEAKSSQDFNSFIPTRKVVGLTLMLYQIYAIILKKFHFTRRNFYSIGWLTLMSAGIVYIFLAVPIEFDYLYSRPLTPSNISLSSFNATVTAVEHDGSLPRLAQTYVEMFGGKDQVEVINENFEDYIMKKFQISEQMVAEKYLTAATIESDRILAWFNTGSFFTVLPELSLNTIHRAILKYVAGPEFDILVSNKPFNMTEEIWLKTSEGSFKEADILAEDETGDKSMEEELTLDSVIINFIAIFLMFYILLGYWPSIFIAIKVKERVTRSKLLQFICGANRFIYWFASFAVDYVFLMSVIYVIVGIVALNQRAFFRTAEQLAPLMAIFACYGFATLPFIYAASFLFEKHATAETMVPVFGLVCELNDFYIRKL